MSVDMEVFLKEPIPMAAFIAAAKRELAALTPELTGEFSVGEYQNRQFLPLNTSLIGDPDPLLTVTVGGKHLILVVTADLREYYPDDERPLLISFSVSGGGGDPCRLVLASACAICLARLAETGVNGMSIDDFADRVRNENYIGRCLNFKD